MARRLPAFLSLSQPLSLSKLAFRGEKGDLPEAHGDNGTGTGGDMRCTGEWVVWVKSAAVAISDREGDDDAATAAAVAVAVTVAADCLSLQDCIARRISPCCRTASVHARQAFRATTR